MAHDVLAAAEVLGWRRFHLLGHSMGGLVAQRLMIDAPERLASSLLLAPVPASGAQPNATRRELLRRAIADPAVRRELIDANSGGNRPLAWVDHLLQLSLTTTRPAALAAYLDAWADTDFSREITPAAMPVLVLIGDHDPGATRSRMAETLLRWHPHARLEVLPGIGHYPMQESPAELWTAIARFVSAATA
jgi:pimeloyl-ACP methyl ester carboxylesterase